MLLKMREEEKDGILLIELEGRLQGGDSAEFQERLMKLLDKKPPKTLIDMTSVSRVDSLGLRAFIMASNRVKAAGGRMMLCCLQRIVEDVFDISGFSSFFEIGITRDEAWKALAS